MKKNIQILSLLGVLLLGGIGLWYGEAWSQTELVNYKPKFISRAEWGAGLVPEFKDVGHRGGLFFSKRTRELEVEYDPSIIDDISDKDEASHLLATLEEDAPNLITIHHTATQVDSRRGLSAQDIVRSIYRYHTQTKGWPDIAYHYLIDKKGNIYEGVNPVDSGTHVAFRNTKNLGVSLIGNFHNEKPTEKQIDSLKLLLAHHSQVFDIDPEGSSNYFGELVHNIAGHNEVADHDHGTSCPGEHLDERLPEIRRDVAGLITQLRQRAKYNPRGLDFLSAHAKKFQKVPEVREKRKEPVSAQELPTRKVIQRGKKGTLELKLTNNTKNIWPRGTTIQVRNIPEGFIITKLYAMEDIAPSQTGNFRARYYAYSVPNGSYDLEIFPDFLRGYTGVTRDKHTIKYPIQISGDYGNIWSQSVAGLRNVSSRLRTSIPQHKTLYAQKEFPVWNERAIKIKLAYFHENYAEISGDGEVRVFDQDKKYLFTLPKGESLKVFGMGERNDILLLHEGQELILKGVSFISNGILTVHNYNRGLSQVNAYNEFRRWIHVYPTSRDSKELLLVNELPIEEYVWGLAEEPKTEPLAKKEAIEILARSYAYVYGGTKRKFNTALYDLEDSPATSQFYLGYGWERLHPEQKARIIAHKGTVITYDGIPVIGPYFTQSSGWTSDKWSYAYPWTKAQRLPADDGLEPRGHGVGLSGNTARVLAQEGKTTEEILKFFFEGIDVQVVK